MTTQNNQTEKQENLPAPKPALAMTGKGFEPTDINQAWRFAEALAASSIVPSRYAGKPGDCLIMLDLASRLQVSWMAVMQHVYNVKGRPAMESVLSTALTHRSGLFVDPLEYDVEGENADDDNYRVRAHAKRKSTGTMLYGPWITWKLVKAEGWLNKDGSKWKTMPEQMFHYRAAAWFTRRHCPGVTMGMLTVTEAEELPRKHVDSMTFSEAQEQAKEQIEQEMGSEQVEVKSGEETNPQAEPRPEENLTPQQKAAKTRAENKAKKEAAKKQQQAPKEKPQARYHCKNAKEKHWFDEPYYSGPKDQQIPICPDPTCLTADIVDTQAPDFMQD